MFPDCVLPGCRNPVTDLGDTCCDCVRDFGDMLRPGARLTAQQIDERDTQVRNAYAGQRNHR